MRERKERTVRAIDADALQRAIVEEGQANKRKKYSIGDIWELTGAEIRDVINSQPTIQPEIVRCKDCKHWREGTAFSYCDKLYGMGILDALDYMVAEDDYCSMAERRTDERSD